MSLFIADSDGTLVYKSLSVKERAARDLLCVILEKETKSGVFKLQNKSVLVREITVRGKKQLFVMDFDSLSDRFGDIAENAANMLLDSAFLEKKRPREVSVFELARVFGEVYAPKLRERGTNISLRFMTKNVRINTSVSALLFCLSLMVSAFAGEGAAVCLGAEECGTVRFYAESESGASSDFSLASAMLYEIAVTQGFSVEFSDSSISLVTNPADISLYGFKSVDDAYLKQVCELCLEFII